MKVTIELAEVLKQACSEVERWQDWQRSSDPLGCEAENSTMKQRYDDSPNFRLELK